MHSRCNRFVTSKLTDRQTKIHTESELKEGRDKRERCRPRTDSFFKINILFRFVLQKNNSVLFVKVKHL